jgi:hypothetical protein
LLSERAAVSKAVVALMIMGVIAGMGLLAACTSPIATTSTPVVIPQYSLTALSQPAGAGSITPDGGTYIGDTRVDITAAPSQGYQFDYWEGDASGNSSVITIEMDKEKSITAHFKANRYRLETSVEPAGAGVITQGSDSYDFLSTVDVKADALPGYAFDNWSGDIGSQSSTLSILVDGKKNLTAHFKPVYTLNISVYPDGTGTTTPATSSFKLGSVVTVIPKPIDGYVFDHWGGDIENNYTVQSITMDRNKTLIANFIPGKVDLKEGINKGLISAFGIGRGYLNIIDVKITSNCKSAISVDIPTGMMFTSPPEQCETRIITIENNTIRLDPGAVKQISIQVASIDMLSQSPGKTSYLQLNDIPLPDDIQMLLKSKAFLSATVRIRQFAVWIITEYPRNIMAVKIGHNEGDAQSATKDELDQITNMFKEAGVSEKYKVPTMDYKGDRIK